ncbi:MAG: hypothetical protein Alis3KO_01010 [Aliiglaciecola sp.]
MAFKLTQDTTVSWPVTLSVPTDGGKIQEQRCHAVFDVLDQATYQKVITKGDVAFLMRVVVGFGEDIQDENGQPLACNKQNKKALFGGPAWRRTGFIAAYMEAATGHVVENLKKPSGTGRPGRRRQKRK